MLGISTKGRITALLSPDTKLVKKWRGLGAKLRSDVYYLRFWKGVATKFISRCNWCRYFNNGVYVRCIRSNCKYIYSAKKASITFSLSYEELNFVLKNLSLSNQIKFKKFLRREVVVLVPTSHEVNYHDKLCRFVCKKLTSTGGFSSKIKKGKILCDHFGLSPEDIKADLLMQISYLIRRYDYLDPHTLLKTCSHSLGNHLNNMVSSYFSNKRKTLFKSNEGGDEKHDLISGIPSSLPSPLDMAMEKNLKSSTVRVIRSLDLAVKDAENSSWKGALRVHQVSKGERKNKNQGRLAPFL